MLDVVIDVSHHNTITSWTDAKSSGIVGVIHQATQGTSYVDPTYASRKQEALAAGLLWGAYHCGEGGSARTQAEHFLEVVQPEATDLLVLYWDDAIDSPMTAQEAEWFALHVGIATRRTPGLYVGQTLLTDALADSRSSILQHSWLMITHYSSQAPDVPQLWPSWTMWQYTSTGSVPGVDGDCDRDQFNGDELELRRLWGVEPPELLV
jgi:lysozyme